MERYLWIENNRLKWNVTKGEDIKISDNIYVYIVDAWKLQNDRLDSGGYKLKGKISVPDGGHWSADYDYLLNKGTG